MQNDMRDRLVELLDKAFLESDCTRVGYKRG